MSIAPIVKRVVVDSTQERAFELFAEQLGSWWPLNTHSIDETQATTVELEGAVGGRIVEYGDDGTEVELTHTGWQRRPDGSEVRGSYDWDHVLDLYLKTLTQ